MAKLILLEQLKISPALLAWAPQVRVRRRIAQIQRAPGPEPDPGLPPAKAPRAPRAPERPIGRRALGRKVP